MGSSDDQALTLGLGFTPSTTTTTTPAKHSPPPPFQGYEPSLTLSLSGESYFHQPPTSADHQVVKKVVVVEQQPPCSNVSAAASASSLSNTTATPGGVFLSVKRERETASSDDLGGGSSRVASDDEEDGTGPVGGAATRKKLRLTKDQSALLEESFKQHSTLNPKQKQALAERLNLRPRQVEVWFQNRRARTKLKQTEVDCEYLKKCCQTLTDENRRLQKELEELKALKMGQPSFYMHLPAATLTMCPSCERIGAAPPPGVAAAKAAAPLAFGPGPGSKPHFYSAFPNPTAC